MSELPSIFGWAPQTAALGKSDRQALPDPSRDHSEALFRSTCGTFLRRRIPSSMASERALNAEAEAVFRFDLKAVAMQFRCTVHDAFEESIEFGCEGLLFLSMETKAVSKFWGFLPVDPCPARGMGKGEGYRRIERQLEPMFSPILDQGNIRRAFCLGSHSSIWASG